MWLSHITGCVVCWGSQRKSKDSSSGSWSELPSTAAMPSWWLGISECGNRSRCWMYHDGNNNLLSVATKKLKGLPDSSKLGGDVSRTKFSSAFKSVTAGFHRDDRDPSQYIHSGSLVSLVLKKRKKKKERASLPNPLASLNAESLENSRCRGWQFRGHTLTN